MPSFHELDSARILETIDRLCGRIEKRFPGTGLLAVARDFASAARESSRVAATMSVPNWPLRIVGGLLTLVLVALALYALAVPWTAGLRTSFTTAAEYVQAIESGINNVVFVGIAVYFLATIEGRIKRKHALDAIHQLRSLAHVVDMHQLTKDPEGLLTEQPETPEAGERRLTSPELGRYLDYCSELLSLVSKISALFVQRFNDQVVLAAVDEVQDLTTGLSSKIWQKITILEQGARAR